MPMMCKSGPRNHITPKTWEEVTGPIFKKAEQLFDSKIEKRAHKYAKILHDNRVGSRITKVAVGIYVAVLETDLVVSQRFFSQQFDISPPTFRKWVKKLFSLLSQKQVRKLQIKMERTQELFSKYTNRKYGWYK